MPDRCPSPASLESFALRGESGSGVAEHVERCRACREYVEDARENEAFLGRAAPALAGAIPAPPTPLDRNAVEGFVLVEEISRGGQGVVYRAVQAATKRPAAVKMLLAGAFATERQRRRFDREVEVAARLRHPNVVSVFESGETADGSRYVAMEFVDGLPLDRYLRERAPAPGRERTAAVLRLFVQIASGVAAAHAAGVIHRDLKPSNIMVDADGVPRVLDFGLARPIGDRPDATHTHEFAGTPAYAAPEQFAGDGSAIGTATDVYSLGVLLYSALTGRHPYPRDGSLADLARHATTTDPPPPSRFVPRLASDAETIVLTCLAKDPQRRYRSAGSLAADIGDYLAGLPISARRDSAIYVLRRLAMRHRGTATAALVVMLTIVGAIVGLALLASDLDRERRSALDALRDSRIHRARLMSAAGELDQAEESLWREALLAGVRAHDPNFGVEHDATQRRVSWALIEYYSRVPRAMRVRLGAPIDRMEASDDGSTIHGAAVDGSSGVWTREGMLLRSTPALGTLTPGSLPNFRFTRDLSRHAVFSDGALRIMDTRSGATVAGPVAIEPPPRSFWLTRDGVSLIVWDEDRSVRVLDGTTLAERGVLVGPEAMVHGVRPSGEGWAVAALCVAPPRALLRFWSTDTLEELPVSVGVQGHAVGLDALRDSFAPIANPELSADLRWVAAGQGGGVVLWRTDRPDSPTMLQAHQASVSTCFISADSTIVVSSSNDGDTCVWSLPGGDLLQRWSNASRALCTSVRGDLGLVAIGDIRGFITLYELGEIPWLRTVPAPPLGIMALAAGPDGQSFAWGGEDGVITLFDARARSAAHEFHAHGSLIAGLCYSPDGGVLYSASTDGSVRAWNAATGSPERTIAEGRSAFWSIDASRDGRFVAASGIGGIVHLWDTATWTERTMEDIRSVRVANVAFSPDGRTIAAVSAHTDTPPCVWDAQSGALLFRLVGHTREVRALAFSPDGRTIATGSDDRTIRLWDARTGRLVRTIAGLARDPFELAFDPSGRILYCVGRGPALGVYDPVEGIELASITVHERLVFGLAVSDDGKTLVTGGEDDSIAFWDMDHLFSYVRGNAARWEEQIADEIARAGLRGVTRSGPRE